MTSVSFPLVSTTILWGRQLIRTDSRWWCIREGVETLIKPSNSGLSRSLGRLTSQLRRCLLVLIRTDDCRHLGTHFSTNVCTPPWILATILGHLSSFPYGKETKVDGTQCDFPPYYDSLWKRKGEKNYHCLLDIRKEERTVRKVYWYCGNWDSETFLLLKR